MLVFHLVYSVWTTLPQSLKIACACLPFSNSEFFLKFCNQATLHGCWVSTSKLRTDVGMTFITFEVKNQFASDALASIDLKHAASFIMSCMKLVHQIWTFYDSVFDVKEAIPDSQVVQKRQLGEVGNEGIVSSRNISGIFLAKNY